MQTFADLERDGWNDRAAVYAATTARATTQAIPALLSAVRPRFGQRILDVCTGPGFAGGAAAAIGCEATGVDFAERMVGIASANFPHCRFLPGDGQVLDLDDPAFDAIVCNFGVFHFAEPERAFDAAFKVLAPGGRYAWSQWQGPASSAFFGVIFGAVSKHAVMDVGLPAAPLPFRFSDRDAAGDAMKAAGFVDVGIAEVPIVLTAPADTFMDFFRKFGVRMTMVLERQDPAVQRTIEREIASGLARFTDGGTLHVPMPALVVSGRKPD